MTAPVDQIWFWIITYISAIILVTLILADIDMSISFEVEEQ